MFQPDNLLQMFQKVHTPPVSQEFSMGTGKSFLVIKPLGQALIQLAQLIHKLSSALMILANL
jgi:hypothetical protein